MYAFVGTIMFKSHHKACFETTNCMSHKAFNKLLLLLVNYIMRDQIMCGAADPVHPELVVAIGIQWLAGGSCIDICNAYGCSVPSIHRFRDLILDEVLACRDFEIVFPETREEEVLKVA
jgi:hypothetical protein